MSEAAKRALASIARDARSGRAKDGRARRGQSITVMIGEAEPISEGDDSRRAYTGEAAGVGAAFGEMDDEDEEN